MTRSDRVHLWHDLARDALQRRAVLEPPVGQHHVLNPRLTSRAILSTICPLLMSPSTSRMVDVFSISE